MIRRAFTMSLVVLTSLLASAQAANSAADQAGGAARSKATDAAGKASDKATDAAGKATDKATDAAGKASDKATDAAGKATDKAGSAADQAADKAGGAADKMKGTETDAHTKMRQDFEAAWKSGDPKAMAEHYASDATLVTPDGRTAIGRDNIQKLFADEQAGPMKGSTMTAVCMAPQKVAPDVQVEDCHFDIAGMKAQNGSTTTMSGMYTNVFVKKGGKWEIEATRAMSLVPMPGGKGASQMQMQDRDSNK